MIKVIKMFMLICCSYLAVAELKAEGLADKIIDKVVDAYGGKSFLDLKSLNVKDRYKSFRYGQSESPTAVDLVSYRSDNTIDFKGKRKDFKWIRGSSDSFSIQHQIFDGSQGYQLNHNLKTLSANSNLTYASADRRHFYYLDTVLAVLLNENRASVKLLGKENSLAKLVLTISGYEELTLYINEQTGLIEKMSKAYWQAGKFFIYNYSDIKQQKGVSYAASTYVTRGGQPYMISVARELTINPNIADDFILPRNYKENTPTLSFDEMIVEKLADNIYLAGKDWGFSIFLDAGDYFIGTGGYEELARRFSAVQKFSGSNKPLKYQVVSHHHNDHLGGMKEANELGVNFITVKEHQAIIEELAGATIEKSRVTLVESKASFADGKLQVIDFASGHATHNLISYFPQAKLLFTADMFFSRKVTGSPNGGATLQSLNTRLMKEQFDVDYFAGAHSGRVLTAKDFDYALHHIDEAKCPADWQICESFSLTK